MVPEYAATLATFLNGKVHGEARRIPPRPKLETTMKNLTALGEKSGLVFGKPSASQDQNAFATTTAFADKYGVKPCPTSARCSGAAHRPGWSAGVPAAAEMQRPGLDVQLPGGKFSSRTPVDRSPRPA